MARALGSGWSPFGRNEMMSVSAILISILMIIMIVEPFTEQPPSWWVDNYMGPGHAGGSGVGEPIPGTVDVMILEKDGYLDEGYETAETFQIGDVNGTGNATGQKVLRVTVELTWQDDIGDNDVFKMTIRNVFGEILVEGEDSTGSIRLEIKASDMNGTGGGGQEEATGLNGSYEVAIECVSAPGLIPAIPFDRDTGNSWSLKVTAAQTEAEG